MTRDQAVQEYITEVVPGMIHRDLVAIRSGFCDFIDGLERASRITEKQAEKWIGLKPNEIKKARSTVSG